MATVNPTFTAAAIRNIAKTAPKPLANIKGLKTPLFGSRMFEVNFTVKNGWETPVIRDYGDLEVRPQIAALHYGLQVFDHMLVTREKANSSNLRMYRPDIFLDRLARSRDYLFFAKYDDKELIQCIKALVREDEPSIPTAAGQNFLVRTTIIGNNNNLSAGPADEFKLFIFGTPVDTTTVAPLKLKADMKVRRSWHGGTGDLSLGGNYANQIYHERESRTQGYDRHLWTLDDGSITTAGDSNIFAVFKRPNGSTEVVAPSLDGTVLRGVIRDSVLALLRAEGQVTVTEGKITVQDLRVAAKSGTLQEVFTTSSAAITRPVGNLWYDNELLTIPTSETGVAARMKEAITKIQVGSPSAPAAGASWSVPV